MYKVEPKVKVDEKEVEKEVEVEKQAPVVSDRDVAKIGNEREASVRSAWAKERKVTILIPFAQGEEKLSAVPQFYISINGVEMFITKNQYTEVPESVAEVIKNSLNQTSLATNQFRIDGDSNKEKALL